jgi:ATP diphosphatase
VVHGLAHKLLRRHPHVFADGAIEGVVAAETDANTVKQPVGGHQSGRTGSLGRSMASLDDVPLNLPALPRAQKLQKRAARVGFDWESSEGVVEKLDEELEELHEARARGDAAAVEEEIGDLLFTLVNLARHEKLDAESALRRSSAKFEARFRTMERLAEEGGRRLEDEDTAALEELWNAAKHDDGS